MPWLVLAFCAGAAAVHLLPELPTHAGLLGIAMAGLLVRRRWPVVAALLLGLAWTAFGARQIVANDWPCARDREVVELHGVVSAPATMREGRVEFDIRVVDPAGSGAPSDLRLSWYEATAIPLPGQHWRMTARLRCRNGFSNPGTPDRELELLRQGIGATGYLVAGSAPTLLADLPWQYPVQRLRARIAADISTSPSSSASVAVLQGLSVGVRGNVPEKLWEAFAATGIAHLMAISGLHVTGCALVALLLLRVCWRFPWLRPRRGRIAIEMAVVVMTTIAYAALAGASLPTLRTLVMVGIVSWQRVLRRAMPVHLSLALAALLLVAADPLAVSSTGFWLSFVATAALLSLIHAGPGWLGQLSAFLRAQAAILWLLTPVLAVAFGRLSFVAPLVNAIAIPVFSLVMLPVILLATALTALWPGSAAGIWQALGAALDATWPWLIAAGQLEFATWWPTAQPVALVITAGATAFVSLLIPLRGLGIAAVVMLLAVVLGRGERPAENAWILTVLDVGQGLATVVQTRNHVLAFDTGPRWRSGSAAARVSLLPWLRAQGIRRIDRLVLSHDDIDHTGGASVLRESFPIAELIVGPGVKTSASSTPCRRGDGWNWDGVEFQVLHPVSKAHGSDNNNSCALRITGVGGSALLLADPEADAEEELLSQSLAADVVLVPHHGSRTSSAPRLIAAIGAHLGIVSAGFGNRWNLPDAGVIARWRAAGATVLTTADVGAITVKFAAAPGGIEIQAHRVESRRWWRRGASR
jgi:competence protein ComEC